VNNPLDAKQNYEYALDFALPVSRLVLSRRVWAFRIRLTFSPSNARLTTVRASVIIFPEVCTKSNVLPLSDPSRNLIRPHTRLLIKGCEKISTSTQQCEKISTSTQLREMLYTDSQDMLVSTVAVERTEPVTELMDAPRKNVLPQSSGEKSTLINLHEVTWGHVLEERFLTATIAGTPYLTRPLWVLQFLHVNIRAVATESHFIPSHTIRLTTSIHKSSHPPILNSFINGIA
jgi:hypothetical protein